MTTAAEVVSFWKAAGPAAWFRKDDGFDSEFRSRFLAAHERAARGELDSWAVTAEGALALLILLDQFPRNSFRGTARMYATDEQALALANRAIAAGHDLITEQALRLFFYLPFEHAENLSDQQRAMQLVEPLGEELTHYARIHLEAIERFGRFPHRNAILGRESTPEELAFLADGGFAG